MSNKNHIPFLIQATCEKNNISTISYEKFDIEATCSKDSKLTWSLLFNPTHHQLEVLANFYKIHELTIEDIENPQLRPKIEGHSNYLLTVLKVPILNYHKKVSFQHIALLLLENHLFSFASSDLQPVLKNALKTVENDPELLDNPKHTHLFYRVIDYIVDTYFPELITIRNKLDNIEERIGEDLQHQIFEDVHNTRKKINLMDKYYGPVKEITSYLLKTNLALISTKNNTIYFQDLNDHIIQIIDELRLLQARAQHLSDLYFSLVNLKTNATMKSLTVVATIFLPLSFIAGVYGMNFQYMPELTWRYGYFIVLAVMLLIGIGILIYLKKKKWL